MLSAAGLLSALPPPQDETSEQRNTEMMKSLATVFI
jgi:hypothetical protein